MRDIQTISPERLSGAIVQAGEIAVCLISPEFAKAGISAVVQVEEGASLFVRSLSIGESNLAIRIELSGRSALCDIRSVVVAPSSSKARIEVETVCKADKTNATIQIAAFALSEGEIESHAIARVEKELSGICARSIQSNVFLGDSGKIQGMPELKIASNDVKARHACSVEKVSSEALFYLRSRGLSEKDATAALLSAKISTIFSDLPEGFKTADEALCARAMGAVIGKPVLIPSSL